MSYFKYMRKRDFVAIVVGGYFGQKLLVGAIKRVLPRT